MSNEVDSVLPESTVLQSLKPLSYPRLTILYSIICIVYHSNSSSGSNAVVVNDHSASMKSFCNSGRVEDPICIDLDDEVEESFAPSDILRENSIDRLINIFKEINVYLIIRSFTLMSNADTSTSELIARSVVKTEVSARAHQYAIDRY